MNESESIVFEGSLKKVSLIGNEGESVITFILPERERQAAGELLVHFGECPLQIAVVKIKNQFPEIKA